MYRIRNPFRASVPARFPLHRQVGSVAPDPRRLACTTTFGRNKALSNPFQRDCGAQARYHLVSGGVELALNTTVDECALKAAKYAPHEQSTAACVASSLFCDFLACSSTLGAASEICGILYAFAGSTRN